MNIMELVKKDKLIKEKISKYEHKRFVFEKLSEKRPFKLVVGMRGVGKTTLLVQLSIKNKGFYISFDDITLKDINLLDLLRNINKIYGYKYFLLDEIQNLENWETKIKDVFEYTDFMIVFTGSSLINLIEKSIDLSRRVVSYKLPPLSFREFLLFKKDVELRSVTIKDIINPKKQIELIEKISAYENDFKEYIKYGAYPFGTDYESTLEAFKNIFHKTIYSDFVKIRELDEKTINEIIKIIKYISQGTEEISYNSLSNSLGISKTKVLSLLDLLEKSMLVVKIEPKVVGKDLLRKHPKYGMLLPLRYLINSMFGTETEIGNLREDAFLTSMFFNLDEVFFLRKPGKVPDYYYNGLVFEIGGKSKTRKQLKDFKNSYVVKDKITLEEKTIPLMLFGLLF